MVSTGNRSSSDRGAHPLICPLTRTTVETLIICRACCPLLVAFLEYQFLGREAPSARSFAVLCTLVLGAAGYIWSDRTMDLAGVSAYRWVAVYYIFICASDTYGKRMSGKP